jgi:Xaa-Pro aminopeptidase
MLTNRYIQRRQDLFNAMPASSLAIIASGSEQVRNRDTGYTFRPHSDFYYLTGFSEPDSVLIFDKTAEVEACYLCLRPKNPERETWDGLRLGIDAAPSHLQVNSAHDIAELDKLLTDWLANKAYLWLSFEQAQDWTARLLTIITQLKRRVRQGVEAPKGIHDLDTLLHEQRLIKDAMAQRGLQHAAQVTVAGHLAAMKATQSDRYEYQIQAALEYECRNQGAHRQAFDSIVAGGKNACILHYNENNALLRDGDLLLIDAGAEIDGYAGDCTHTFPINGTFNREQAALYDLVLAAQQAAFDVIRPNTPYNQPHQRAIETISQGLLDLGLLQGDLASVLEQESYKPFYMHQTGHWLGCDVHDVGAYKQQGNWRALEAGMALTVEPGIYISPSMTDVPSAWRGIGIRIEDSVLVNATGYDCLTTGLPRTRSEIEAWMKAR